ATVLRTQHTDRGTSVASGQWSVAGASNHEQFTPDPSALRTPHSAISFGGLWLDGFAEMTPQELDFLAALAPFCQQATLAFCLDHEPQEDVSWLSTWSIVSQTFRNCHQRLTSLPECTIRVEVLPRERDHGRFSANPALAHLEKHWTNPKPFAGEPAVPAGQSRRDACPALKEALFIALCPNPEAEAVLAAREILRHVRGGGRYRECAVLLRNLEDYHDVLRRVLRRYEIPFILDRREPVAYHPLAELTRYALRTVAFGWEHDDWFGALKTGLVPADPGDIDRLENEALARGWRGKAWQEPLKLGGDGQLEQRLEGLRLQIVPPFRQLGKRCAADAAGPHGPPTGSQ